MNRIKKEIKSATLFLLFYFIGVSVLYYSLSIVGIYNGGLLEFLGEAFLVLILLFVFTTPSVLKKMKEEKEEKNTEIKLNAIPDEVKFCNNCKYATLSHENKYKCSEGTFKELVDGNYCCVFWEPNLLTWDKFLSLQLK